MIALPEMAAILEIYLARRYDPDLEREVGPSTRHFEPPASLVGVYDPSRCGIDVDADHQSLQLLNNVVTRGLTVKYIRNPNAPVIERSIRIWKAQLLELIFAA